MGEIGGWDDPLLVITAVEQYVLGGGLPGAEHLSTGSRQIPRRRRRWPFPPPRPTLPGTTIGPRGWGRSTRYPSCCAGCLLPGHRGPRPIRPSPRRIPAIAGRRARCASAIRRRHRGAIPGRALKLNRTDRQRRPLCTPEPSRGEAGCENSWRRLRRWRGGTRVRAFAGPVTRTRMASPGRNSTRACTSQGSCRRRRGSLPKPGGDRRHHGKRSGSARCSS